MSIPREQGWGQVLHMVTQPAKVACYAIKFSPFIHLKLISMYQFVILNLSGNYYTDDKER